MDPKRYSWGSFQSAGGERTVQRSTLKDYIWFMIGAALAFAILFSVVYVLFEMGQEDRRERNRMIAEWRGEKIQPFTMDDVYRRAKIAGAVGAVIGLGLGLLYGIKCMANERHEEELRKSRRQLEAARHRTGFKVD